jgi:hypothetical protein
VTSKKFITRKFASAVIFKLNCSNVLWSFFSCCLRSAKRADLLLMIANPPSLYRPIFTHRRAELMLSGGRQLKVCPNFYGGLQ